MTLVGLTRVLCSVLFFSSFELLILSFDFRTLPMFTCARITEPSSEEKLNLCKSLALVCRVPDQRRFTGGVEVGFESRWLQPVDV